MREQRTMKPSKCRTTGPDGYPFTCVWLDRTGVWCAKYGRPLNLEKENPPNWCKICKGKSEGE